MHLRNRQQLFAPRTYWRISIIVCSLLSLAIPCLGQIEQGKFGRVRHLRGVSSFYRDANPFFTSDGLTAYFSSSRPSRLPWDDDLESWDIWSATRSSTDDNFENVQKVEGTVSRPGIGELNPKLSEDGLRLYYASSADEETGEILFVSRETIDSEWGAPESVGAEVNREELNVSHPHLSLDELTIYYGASQGLDQWDLYQATRSSIDEPFRNATRLEGVSTDDYEEWMPTVSRDGRTIFYATPRDGQGFLELWVATRDSVNEPFSEGMPINDFAGGSSINTASAAEFTPWISNDWPAPGSKLYLSRAFEGNDWDIYETTWEIPGFMDINLDGNFTPADIDALSIAIRENVTASGQFDLNADGSLDQLDRQTWLDRMNLYVGDANLDGEFNSLDFVSVFSAGKYDDGIPNNSGWEEGDWNGDGDFDSGDFVVAFQDGGYEQGPRITAHSVPEPACSILLSIGIIALHRFRRV